LRIHETAGVVGALAVREARRRTGEHGHDLSADVDVGVVVVAELGGDDAEAGEDDGRLDAARGLVAGVDEDVLAVLERAAIDRERGVCGVEERGLHADVLKVRAAVAGRLRADGLELRGDVCGRDVVAARAGLAAFDRVAGEEVDVGADRVRGNGQDERECGGDHVQVSISVPLRASVSLW
jgi:hypothetical protein